MLQLLETTLAKVTNGRVAEAVEAVTENPEIVLARFSDGATLLVRASAVHGAAPLIETLVRLGANPNDVSREGNTAIGASIEGDRAGGHETLNELKTLLSLGADPNVIVNGGNTALQYAILLGKISHARILLELGADPYKPSADQGSGNAFDLARAIKSVAALTLLEKFKSGSAAADQ